MMTSSELADARDVLLEMNKLIATLREENRKLREENERLRDVVPQSEDRYPS